MCRFTQINLVLSRYKDNKYLANLGKIKSEADKIITFN